MTVVKLMQDGRLLRQNIKKELISEEELLSQLRLQGLPDESQTRKVQRKLYRGGSL